VISMAISDKSWFAETEAGYSQEELGTRLKSPDQKSGARRMLAPSDPSFARIAWFARRRRQLARLRSRLIPRQR
jgi:hypothetical protein